MRVLEDKRGKLNANDTKAPNYGLYSFMMLRKPIEKTWILQNHHLQTEAVEDDPTERRINRVVRPPVWGHERPYQSLDLRQKKEVHIAQVRLSRTAGNELITAEQKLWQQAGTTRGLTEQEKLMAAMLNFTADLNMMAMDCLSAREDTQLDPQRMEEYMPNRAYMRSQWKAMSTSKYFRGDGKTLKILPEILQLLT